MAMMLQRRPVVVARALCLVSSSTQIKNHSAATSTLDANTDAEAAGTASRPRRAHASKSTAELARAGAVFAACATPGVVSHAGQLLRGLRGALGPAAASAVVRETAFKHFVAGESAADAVAAVSRLRRLGLGAILDYAAEGDASPPTPPTPSAGATDGPAGWAALVTRPGEAPLITDSSHGLESGVLECLRTAAAARDANHGLGSHGLESHGFANHGLESGAYAAVKLSSLADPAMLAAVSSGLRTDDDAVDSFVTTGRLLPRVLGDRAGFVAAWEGLGVRLVALGASAARLRVALLFDAEASWVQPAIDAAAARMQLRHNGPGTGGPADTPAIWTTAQAYLTDAPARLKSSLDTARRLGYRPAFKLVRGAYLGTERSRAATLGLPPPVHASLAATHASFDACLALGLESLARDAGGLIVATHNAGSAFAAAKGAESMGLPRSGGGLRFATLYGMADDLACALADEGYESLKYLPYGGIQQVMPYLLRRLAENGEAVSGRAWAELAAVGREVGRRIGARAA